MKVLTLNMQYGQIWEDENPDEAPIDVSRMIKELIRFDADLIFLQEVESVDVENGQLFPPPNFSKIQEALSSYFSVFSYPKADKRELPFGYGLAVFSKTRLYGHQFIDLPAPNLEFDFYGTICTPTDRLLLKTKTEIDGREIVICNTHLQSFFVLNKSSDDYPEQRETLLKSVLEEKEPVVLAGDFNSAPFEGLVKQFEDSGLKSLQKSEITWKREPYVLDHIFISPEFECKKVVVQDTNVSDHKFVWAELEFKSS